MKIKKTHKNRLKTCRHINMLRTFYWKKHMQVKALIPAME